MIFKSLKLENIRSFKNCHITFPKGITLFEGDVGSGKSSILMAIEFALFGLGNQKGESLLRKKTDMGSVVFEFEVNNDNYKVKRTLIKRKKKSKIQKKRDIKGHSSEKNSPVWQSEGYLIINGVKSHLSPSEIKERILDILNFKEPPNPRAQSVIFRYAVYTPQEEMKFILTQKPDTRLQTLRKAFGIEDYKIAAENAFLISRAIKEKISYLSGQTSDLTAKKDALVELKVNLEENEENLRKFKEEMEKIEVILTGQKEELEKLKVTKSELEQIESQIPHVEKQRDDKVELLSAYERDIQSIEKENQEKLVPDMGKLGKLEKPTHISQDKLKEKLGQIKEAIKKRGELMATLNLLKETKRGIEDKLKEWKDKSLDELNKENERLTVKLKEVEDILSSHQGELDFINKKIYKLETRIEDIDKKLKNLDDLGETCPICGSVLDEEHKKDLKQEREEEIQKLNSKINELNQVKSKGDEVIGQDKTNIKETEKELNEYKLLIDKFIDLNKVKSKIDKVEENISNIDETLSLNMNEDVKFENFDEYIKHMEDLLERFKDYNQAQQSLEDIKYRFNRNNDKIRENKANIEILKGEIEGLKKKYSTFQDKIKDLPEIVEKVGELTTVYEDTKKEYSLVNEKVISSRTLIEKLTQDVRELEDEVIAKERLLKQLDNLKDYHIWLNDYLIPTLDVIEKHVMQNIQQEFDVNFKKMFSLLIDDPSKTGRIDEEFTPIIEQDGYQQEINYLSGGEKTSIALAYRLALNNIVQKVSTGLTSNLLLLDEPTDGFSKEQLFKIRDILNELNYPQIIIVSHERELESFADNLFRIEKINGVSEVTRVS